MADTADSRRRWDTDDRFVGVADASSFATAVEELAALARRPGWVAEEPEVHLVPHLRAASAAAGLRLITCDASDDGVLEIAAEHGPGDSRGEIRWRAWSLIGAVAEPAASVRERRGGDTIIFEIITGIPDRSGPFASHGHTLRLTIRPPGAP
jgi:hypothetical protein